MNYKKEVKDSNSKNSIKMSDVFTLKKKKKEWKKAEKNKEKWVTDKVIHRYVKI